jgi:hypothetical protein
MRLKVSLGCIPSMHSFMAFFAVSMRKPLIEPLLSMANMICLGTIRALRTRLGGCKTRVKNFPRWSVCVSTVSAISSPAVW